MTDPRTPDQLRQNEAFSAEIDRIVGSADVHPRTDLADRVLQRVAAEPTTSAPRRFFAAVAALDMRASIRMFRQTMAAAWGGTRLPAIVRFQAIAVVMLIVSLVGTAGVLGAAATISIAEIVKSQQRGSERRVTKPRPDVRDAAWAGSAASRNDEKGAIGAQEGDQTRTVGKGVGGGDDKLKSRGKAHPKDGARRASPTKKPTSAKTACALQDPPVPALMRPALMTRSRN